MLFPKKTGLLALIFCVAVTAALGAEPGRQILRGHVPEVVSKLKSIGDLPATNQLHLAIGLPLRNEEALNRLLQEIYDPASPNYHRYLTPEQFTEQFGPTEQDYQAVINFARTNGLTIMATHPNRVLVDVGGSAATVEKAFQVTLRVYRHPQGDRNFFAPDSEPTIGSGIPISHVSGLDNFVIPQPALVKKKLLTNKLSGASPASGSGIAGLYAGNDFHTAYAPGVALNGAGQSVALFELEGYYTNDIVSYENQTGLPNLTLTNVLVDGFSGTPSTADTNGVIEVALDIEMAVAMATNLSSVIVYEGQNGGNIADYLNRIATDNLAKQISSSWLIGNNSSFDTAYKQMAAQGQSFFQASGDDGAYYSGIAQSADDTNVTLVGGTTLTMNGSGSSYASETVWNWYSTGEGTAGSGGGISLNNTPIPSWQTNISMTANQGSTTLRNVPDVALTADGILVVAFGGNFSVGGTSAAAPLWAGFTALINQQAASLGESPVGFLNPAVYALGKSANYPLAFHDITTGNNTNSSVGTKYFAAPGYDLCTGWGTPNGQNFINALAPDTLVLSPAGGFTAAGMVGGIFNPSSQNYLLTNASAVPVNWSLSNPSAWLNVSATNGTILANGTNGVTISLNSAASSLAVGNYSAVVQFSNANTHIVQSLLFNLQVADPLALLTTNGFTTYGPAGGQFYPASQNMSFTNQSASSVNWSIVNPAAWLSVSPSSGSISGNSSVSVMVTTNAATAALANGTYNATLLLSNLSSHVTQGVAFSASVGQSLVQNGGFETGDFTGWTLNGTGGNANYVDGSGTYVAPHSGTYCALLGESGSQAYLSQTLPTINGQKYLLSLWLNNPLNGSHSNPNEFSVAWNGSTLYDKVNFAKISWTNLQFVVTATGASTVLQIGGRDDNYYLGLDDVSVTPGFAPSISMSPTNLAVLPGSNAVFTASAGGSASLIYQWRKNGTNLANGAGISGATTTNLTLTAVTTNSAANYSLFVTNIFGVVTSSVASLTILLPPAINAVAANPDGSFSLNLTGSPGYTYILEATTNLFPPGNWLPIATNILGTNGIWSFTDTAATNFPLQFYRLMFAQ